MALGQVSKDSGTKYENLVKGLRHIKIKVCGLVLHTMMIHLALGVASRSIRRRSRVHGIPIEVLRKCPWSYLEDKLCRNFDIAIASNWEGKGLPSQRLKILFSRSFGRPLKQKPIILNGGKRLRLSTPKRER